MTTPKSLGTPSVYGVSVSPTTQCLHWHSPLDVIAIKHFCCRNFYACISCHDAIETHKSDIWPKTHRSEPAVLCGVCKHVLTVDEYMQSGSRCTSCGQGFNPGCKGHWGLYFELEEICKIEGHRR
ncbi:zinc finger CHY domain-containing protein [Polyplosphaeria fusca]|uniref:Zinc finger CHY domain-containing protein n=1 Tax=Polyplosphaeria fusca TaxID=682080 RepID=A0A9P4QYY3_9PLEO|nr:zinc finger CHY domain-containing protein [Polyplosphaeria fusca]